ncbi:MAG: hypothetical protein ACUBOA_07365 [Candidatus Loosdrechtia sp.]|uniref:hypothetical protein n=1 Tax=Candidatus Loosdrechtia sp. TaxID=3101272 RepID=UPI003A68E520|nr:MAG: hypothetical protein QY305_00990 [Candidatus Jettenia sp. AMX2]
MNVCHVLLQKTLMEVKLVFMNLEFDPNLIEEVIFGELKAREERGDFTLTTEYHSFTDPVYENFPLDERPGQFRKIEWDFFRKLGFFQTIKEIFDEFPGLEERVSGGVITKARNPFDEGSNLTKGPKEGNEQKRLVVKVLPERFQEVSYLKKLVRHELMHVTDMLSESFGYRDERLGSNPMEESIIKERYGVFWDIFVDSRLIRNGKETVSDREGRYLEFDALYKKIPSEVKAAIFNALWQDENLTHDRIFEMSKDVNKVVAISEGMPIMSATKMKKSPLPGAQCPLCQFRTYHWVENVEQDASLVENIKRDFPGWEPEDGICERCSEVYKVRVSVC